MSSPWWAEPSHEVEPVGADETLPKWKFWRREPKPSEPAPCKTCGQDTRGIHIEVARDRFCLSCGMKAARDAQ